MKTNIVSTQIDDTLLNIFFEFLISLWSFLISYEKKNLSKQFKTPISYEEYWFEGFKNKKIGFVAFIDQQIRNHYFFL